MKIAVVAANGKAGKLIVKEACDRGLDVTAIARGENQTATSQYLRKDLFDLTTQDLSGYDVVVNAFGAWMPETIPGIPASTKYLGDLIAGTPTRLVVVGGAGSLFVNPEHTITVDMGPDFPEDWKPLSAAHGEGLAFLRNTDNLNWTYVSPAADFQAEGERTGEYLLGGEELTLNEKGESMVSYADYAIALVDEIEKGDHIKERISVVGK